MIADIRISGNQRMRVDVVKLNAKTVLVRLPDGNTIKRHIRKHDVNLTPHEGITFAPVTVKWWIEWGFFKKLWYGLFGG